MNGIAKAREPIDLPWIKEGFEVVGRNANRPARIVCNIHPMPMCQPGWIEQGDRKLVYAVDNYTDAGPHEFYWRGRDIRQICNATS